MNNNVVQSIIYMSRRNFNNVIDACRNNSLDELFKMQQQIKEENIRKIYLKKAKKEMLFRSKSFKEIISILKNKHFNTYSEWFEWSQCKSSDYNKYYKILLADLKTHIEEYEKVYNLLYDKKSKQVFSDICTWRLNRNSSLLIDAYSKSKKEQYFEDFLKLNNHEIFVDCGGYIGDSTLGIISYCGGISDAYIYEADISNLEKAKDNLKGYNVKFRDVGVSNKNEVLSFEKLETSSSGFTNNGNEKIQVVPIDEDIPKETKISFIKIDIEGMELKALEGAKNHIANDRPVLAVCLYHNPQDLWEIPLYIEKIVGEKYRFFIRHYTIYHGETVFYAVPLERYK